MMPRWEISNNYYHRYWWLSRHFPFSLVLVPTSSLVPVSNLLHLSVICYSCREESVTRLVRNHKGRYQVPLPCISSYLGCDGAYATYMCHYLVVKIFLLNYCYVRQLVESCSTLYCDSEVKVDIWYFFHFSSPWVTDYVCLLAWDLAP